ncbi:MAG: transporter substrate-binding domain-containing protein [Desulfamplus sp.]|nr:transporter substrate-binding domain-containing protein [Desulfamplus sp.]
MLKLIIGITVLLTGLTTDYIRAETLIFVTTDWPPYTIGQDEDVSGIDVEIIQEFIKRNKIDAKILAIPWKRALDGVEEGFYHAIFTLKKTAEREKFLHYPTEQLENELTAIFSIKGKNIKAKSLEDLKNQTVGVVRGYTYGKEFDSSEFIIKDEGVDDKMMVNKLVNGRYDLIAGEEISVKYLANKDKTMLETVYILGDYPTYIGFSIKGLGAKKDKLALQFDVTMRQLVKEGFVEKIRASYMKGQ